MTVPDAHPDTGPEPGTDPADAPAPPTTPASPSRPSIRIVGLWLVIAGVAVALDGLAGGLTIVFVAAVLLAGLPVRVIGGLGVLLLALAPVAFLVEGVPSSSDVSPALVTRSLLPHHLTFSGLVLVSAFALIDLAPHLRSWATAERPVQDDGPPLGSVLGAVVVGAVALGALLACRAVLARVIRNLLDRARASGLLQGSVWLLIGLAIQAVLGLAFQMLGAHVATSSQLGDAFALYAAIQFVNYASGLGLTIALARHATLRNRESDALFGWSVLATTVASVVLGSAYLALVDTRATRLVNGSAGSWAVFCLYTVGTSVLLLVDVRLMAARRWAWLIGRMAVASLVRLPLVLVDVGMSPARWLYTLMLAPLAITGIGSLFFMGRMGGGGINLHRPRTIRPFTRYAGVNWVATLASQAPQFVLPLVVAQSVRASENASFYLAWTVTALVFLLPAAIAQILLVEGGKDAQVTESSAVPGSERQREALVFSLGLAALAWLGSLVVGPAMVAILGSSYDRLAQLLPVLMLAGIPWAVTSVRLSEARIRKDQVATVAITGALGITILVPTVLFVPSGGTTAAATAFLVGNVAGAIVATVVHERWKRSSRTPALVT